MNSNPQKLLDLYLQCESRTKNNKTNQCTPLLTKTYIQLKNCYSDNNLFCYHLVEKLLSQYDDCYNNKPLFKNTKG